MQSVFVIIHVYHIVVFSVR